MGPRVLFVGHTRYDLPLRVSLAKKWDALAEVLQPRVIGAAGPHVAVDDQRFRLVRPRVPAEFHGAAYYATLPAVVASELRHFLPQAIVAESPYEGACALAATRLSRDGAQPKLVIEVHGDWRTAPRLYGPAWRALCAPLSDRAALLALRRADATRAVSRYTAELIERATGKHPLAIFATYTDIESFSSTLPLPFPSPPTAIWIGVLERYKNADGLERIWRRVAARVPEAQLVVIGQGHLWTRVSRLARDLPGRVELIRQLDSPEVSRRLDEATLLVLPSRSEGLPRVVIEAFARGRPVVASAAGGIPDLVVSDRNGVLVPPGDDDAFADAVVNVLSDRQLADRLGTHARADVAPLLTWTPERYASAVSQLIEQALASPDRRLDEKAVGAELECESSSGRARD
jgi:glycosyltransferase involved in cell wall biosynthesis